MMTPATKPLEGRVALITGAGSGIGKAISEALAAAGAGLTVSGRTPKKIEALEHQLSDEGVEILAVPCDVRKALHVDTLVRTTVQHFGRLDIVINNAGILHIAPIEQTDEAVWDAILETNLKGTYLVTRTALPHLRESRGDIVNISSTAGRRAYAGSSAYCASKWGLMGLTGVLREELRDTGIRVMTVVPPAVDTGIWDEIPGDWDRASMLRPETVAQAVLDLLQQPRDAAVHEIDLFVFGNNYDTVEGT
jgi:NAD(P)-dependent dehydrogenase (short-subunit alcohol dehydrogenase family)